MTAEVNAARLRAFVIDRVAAFKAPANVYFTTEPLPRNPAGELLKAEIGQRLLTS